MLVSPYAIPIIKKGRFIETYEFDFCGRRVQGEIFIKKVNILVATSIKAQLKKYSHISWANEQY